MSITTITTSIADNGSKVAFSSNSNRTFTGNGVKAETLLIGIAETELDLSSVGNAGMIAIRNSIATKYNISVQVPYWMDWKVLVGYAAGKYTQYIPMAACAVLHLFPETNKFYLRAIESAASIGPDITADAGTDIITFGSDHGLNVGDRVYFYSEGTLPAGLVDGTNYEVKTVESGTQITLKDGEGTLNITDAGTGTHHSILGQSRDPDTPISFFFHEA